MTTIWVEIDIEGKLTAHNTKASLADMQRAVGGYIEPVDTKDFTVMVNEEGLLIGLPLNAVASAITGRYLVGNVAIVGLPDRYGNTTKLSKKALSFFDIEE